jgi:hypothetical protein
MTLSLVRGARFAGDSDRIAAYIERNKNGNIVVYEDCPASPAGRPPPRALRAYWLDLDPAAVARHRAKGKLDDAVELNFVEARMAYGVASRADNAAPGRIAVTFVAMPGRTWELKDLTAAVFPTAAARDAAVGGDACVARVVPVLVGGIAGADAVLDRVWVQAAEPKHWYSLPSVEYVDIFGVRLSDGAVVRERVAA